MSSTRAFSRTLLWGWSINLWWYLLSRGIVDLLRGEEVARGWLFVGLTGVALALMISGVVTRWWERELQKSSRRLKQVALLMFQGVWLIVYLLFLFNLLLVSGAALRFYTFYEWDVATLVGGFVITVGAVLAGWAVIE